MQTEQANLLVSMKSEQANLHVSMQSEQANLHVTFVQMIGTTELTRNLFPNQDM